MQNTRNDRGINREEVARQQFIFSDLTRIEGGYMHEKEKDPELAEMVFKPIMQSQSAHII